MIEPTYEYHKELGGWVVVFAQILKMKGGLVALHERVPQVGERYDYFYRDDSYWFENGKLKISAFNEQYGEQEFSELTYCGNGDLNYWRSYGYIDQDNQLTEGHSRVYVVFEKITSD